jgi:PAS domain S-box-containing protein
MAIDSMPTTAEDRPTARARARDAHEKDRGVERPLAPSELFFSVTDEKGVITAGSQVFERVSGYSLEELVGRAHNIVRHPEMPRAVFKILWDTIAAGDPVAAYVRNRTADGAYYWVLASVVPIKGGYLSVRLAPSGEHFAIAKTVYEELRALERRIEGDDVRRRKPSIGRLEELLGQAGYGSYHEFMRAALPAEVTRRAGRLQDAHR